MKNQYIDPLKYHILITHFFSKNEKKNQKYPKIQKQKTQTNKNSKTQKLQIQNTKSNTQTLKNSKK